MIYNKTTENDRNKGHYYPNLRKGVCEIMGPSPQGNYKYHKSCVTMNHYFTKTKKNVTHTHIYMNT